MRAAPSPPELLLWQALTNRKLGVSFRRQVPLTGYICDFVCASRRLVVEVDGAHHGPPEALMRGAMSACVGSATVCSDGLDRAVVALVVETLAA